MKKKNYKISKLEELPYIVKNILKDSEHKIFAFFGEMGVGKTTIIKEMVKQLGITKNTSSPTYSIVNEYFSEKLQNSIYHFDFYRLKNEEEAYDMGYEEYFYSKCYCFIEWSEKIPNILPKKYHKINIINENGNRNISIL